MWVYAINNSDRKIAILVNNMFKTHMRSNLPFLRKCTLGKIVLQYV